MHQRFLLTGSLTLVALSMGCAAFSGESVRINSSAEERSFLDLELLPQGIAIGDVSSERALLWLRTDGPAWVRVEWAPLSLWEQVSKLATAVAPVSSTALIRTTAETDYTLTVPLERLSPETPYRYHVKIAGEDQLPKAFSGKLAAKGEFITPPDDKTSTAVTFAWSGDLGGQGRCRRGVGGYPIFDVIHRQNPDFFLFLGDTIYSDHICPSPPNEPGADFKATTLQTYRLRHRYQRGAEALQRFLRMVPTYVIWDDHEVKNNFAGPFEEQMPAGCQALREYWPITSPEEDPHRMYRSVRYGADLELFILDVRQYRSRNVDPDGPDKTMLGSAQLKWLLDGLHASTATWKVIATSVPLSIPKGGDSSVPGNDGWAGGPDGTGFERERQVIVDAILSHKIKNVVFLAGDVHWAEAIAYDPDQDGIIDFHEYTAGPLSAAPGRFSPGRDGLHPTQLFRGAAYHNFGVVWVTKDAFEVTMVDEAGEKRFSHRIPAR
ncbi:MAG: alkaline phosphatase D family protein [Nitrospira sp.]|nr:alkaline phosphatase D family protein [Nitrospira sp.]